MMFQGVDLSILQFVFRFRGRMPRLDEFIVLMAENDLVKGGLLVGLLWWFWFKPGREQRWRREIIVACVFAALAAAMASRTLAHAWMIHHRPFLIASLQVPQPPPILWEDKNSSFPSDHAALAFGLVTGLFLISRKIGLSMGIYALIFICLPRVFLGIHWPSDVLGGIALGTGLATWLCRSSARSRLGTLSNRLAERAPHLFYALAFLVSFGLMTRFDSARSVLSWTVAAMSPARAVTELSHAGAVKKSAN